MANIYYIIDTTNPDYENILRYFYTEYKKIKSNFIPIFNSDKTRCLIKISELISLPARFDSIVLDQGDAAWAIMETREQRNRNNEIINSNTSWEAVSQPRIEDTKEWLEGRIPRPESSVKEVRNTGRIR